MTPKGYRMALFGAVMRLCGVALAILSSATLPSVEPQRIAPAATIFQVAGTLLLNRPFPEHITVTAHSGRQESIGYVLSTGEFGVPAGMGLAVLEFVLGEGFPFPLVATINPRVAKDGIINIGAVKIPDTVAMALHIIPPQIDGCQLGQIGISMVLPHWSHAIGKMPIGASGTVHVTGVFPGRYRATVWFDGMCGPLSSISEEFEISHKLREHTIDLSENSGLIKIRIDTKSQSQVILKRGDAVLLTERMDFGGDGVTCQVPLSLGPCDVIVQDIGTLGQAVYKKNLGTAPREWVLPLPAGGLDLSIASEGIWDIVLYRIDGGNRTPLLAHSGLRAGEMLGIRNLSNGQYKALATPSNVWWDLRASPPSFIESIEAACVVDSSVQTVALARSGTR